jgi:hypothetical protein
MFINAKENRPILSPIKDSAESPSPIKSVSSILDQPNQNIISIQDLDDDFSNCVEEILETNEPINVNINIDSVSNRSNRSNRTNKRKSSNAKKKSKKRKENNKSNNNTTKRKRKL